MEQIEINCKSCPNAVKMGLKWGCGGGKKKKRRKKLLKYRTIFH